MTTPRTRHGDWMQTFTGRQFWPLDPDAASIDIEDIAHALSMQCRYAYMVTEFVDAVRDCLKKGGYAEKHNEAEQGGTFLVGYAGHLFEIHGDYQVAETVDGFSACGCGDMIALGALAATVGDPPLERLYKALQAAERFSGGVRSPFHIESIS